MPSADFDGVVLMGGSGLNAARGGRRQRRPHRWHRRLRRGGGACRGEYFVAAEGELSAPARARLRRSRTSRASPPPPPLPSAARAAARAALKPCAGWRYGGGSTRTCGASGCFGDVTGDGCFDINDVGWMFVSDAGRSHAHVDARRTFRVGRQQATATTTLARRRRGRQCLRPQYPESESEQDLLYRRWAPPTVGTNDYWGVTAVLYDARQQRVGGSAVRACSGEAHLCARRRRDTGARNEAGGGSADAAEPTSAAFPWHELSFDESSFSILRRQRRVD